MTAISNPPSTNFRYRFRASLCRPAPEIAQPFERQPGRRRLQPRIRPVAAPSPLSKLPPPPRVDRLSLRRADPHTGSSARSATKFLRVRIRLDYLGLVSALENVAAPPAAPVVMHGKGRLESSHRRAQISQGRSDHQMLVITHHAVAMHCGSESLHHPGKRLQPEFRIRPVWTRTPGGVGPGSSSLPGTRLACNVDRSLHVCRRSSGNEDTIALHTTTKCASPSR